MSYYADDESVRGTVIGPLNRRYEFWTEDDPPIKIAGPVYFEHDQEAVEWFRENHPDHFMQGAEMRTWD